MSQNTSILLKDFDKLARYHVAQAALAQKAAHKIAKQDNKLNRSNAKLWLNYTRTQAEIRQYEEKGLFEEAFPFIVRPQAEPAEEDSDKEQDIDSMLDEMEFILTGKKAGLVYDKKQKKHVAVGKSIKPRDPKP